MDEQVTSPQTYRERLYAWVAEKLRPGEQVLVVTKRYSFHGCAGFGYEPKPSDYNLECDLCLGMLPKDSALVKMDGDFVSIQVSKHARSAWNVEVKDGPINIHGFVLDFAELESKIYPPDQKREYWYQSEEADGLRKPDFPLEILVGEGVVQAYAVTECLDFYLKAGYLLGIDMSKLRSPLKEYVDAKKGDIMEALLHLAWEEHRIADQNTIKAKRRTVDIHKEMARYIEQAVTWGMHRESSTFTVRELPGMVLDVGELINGLCVKLEIPLPH